MGSTLVRLHPSDPTPGTLALVANRSEGTVSVFSIAGHTLTPVGKISLGDEKSGPSHVAIAPDGKTALVERFVAAARLAEAAAPLVQAADYVVHFAAETHVDRSILGLRVRVNSFSDVAAKVVSIINLASVAALEGVVGGPVDPLRFRGNLYVEGWPAWHEFSLVGSEIAIGETRLKVTKRIVRCAATNDSLKACACSCNWEAATRLSSTS